MYHHLIMYAPWKHFALYLGMYPPRQLRAELVLLSGNFTLDATVEGDEHAFHFTVGLLLFTLYLGVSSKWLHRIARWMLRGEYEGREISLRIHDWSVWWNFWAKSDEWSSRDPKWMRWTWHPLDTFFGHTQHTERELSRTETVIPMPEKAYACVVVMKEERWKRPRLPWPSHTDTRAHIDCPEGVPFPGKGENGWDCGDDASYGLNCPARSVEEGIARFVESVLRSRRRYGGSVNWQKREEQPT